MYRPLSDKQRHTMALRIARVLNDLGGTLHAARAIISKAIKSIQANPAQLTAKYEIRIAFGAIVLSMRKFQDLWNTHIPKLIEKKDDRPLEGKWIVNELKGRNLRSTANQLVAHYSETGQLPIGQDDIESLIQSNKWNTEEELVEWAGPVIEKLYIIRDRIMSSYEITSFEEKK